jgi:hypothetical protein
MMRLTQTATRRNLGLYIAGIDALARGSVRGPQIILDGQFLDCLVVPWPFCLEPGACRVLEQYIAAGGRCILYGQRPGDCSPDDGVLRLLETHFGRGFIQPQRRTIAYEKEKLVGTGPFRDLSLLPTTEETEDRSAVRLRERCGTDSIELQYNPLASEQGEPLLYHQKRPIGVKAADRPFYYFSYEFPLYGVACASLLEALLPTAGHPAVPSHLYVQHYWQNETDLFAVCARTPEGSIAGEMEIAGRRVCLPDAKMAVITVAPGRPASVRAW